jgi:hypothetical protein
MTSAFFCTWRNNLKLLLFASLTEQSRHIHIGCRIIVLCRNVLYKSCPINSPHTIVFYNFCISFQLSTCLRKKWQQKFSRTAVTAIIYVCTLDEKKIIKFIEQFFLCTNGTCKVPWIIHFIFFSNLKILMHDRSVEINIIFD